MKVIFNEVVKELTAPTTEDIITLINDLLGNEFYFSHLLIDGDAVYEQPETVLDLHKDTLQALEVIAIPAVTFIADLISSAHTYLQRALPLLDVTIERFYGVAQSEQWADLNDLFGSIQWLYAMNETVATSIARPTDWDAVQQALAPLASILEDFEQALVQQDQVLIADLLAYEVKPAFEATLQALTSIQDESGGNDATN